MKTRNAVLIGVVLVFLGFMAVAYLVNRAVQWGIGREYVYELSEQPKFLSEALAIAKARETLTRDGLNPAVWGPVVEERTKAPDGSVDRFLLRNTINPNHASIMFTNGTGNTRFVRVELEGSRVVCQTSIGK